MKWEVGFRGFSLGLGNGLWVWQLFLHKRFQVQHLKKAVPFGSYFSPAYIRYSLVTRLTLLVISLFLLEEPREVKNSYNRDEIPLKYL